MKSKNTSGNKRIASDLLFQNFVEQTPVAIQIHSPDGKLIDCNPAYAKLFGLSSEALSGLYQKYNILEDKQALRQGVMPYIERTIEGEIVSFPEYKYDIEESLLALDIKSQGSKACWIKTQGFPIKDAKGNITQAVFISEDITTRINAEKELHDTSLFTKNLIESANIMIVGIDAQGKVNIFNPAAERISGYSYDEIKERDWFSTLVPKEKYPLVHQEFDRLMKGETYQNFENPILTKNGEERIISWTNNQVLTGEQATGLISFGLDITESKIIEDALVESEENFRLLVEQSTLPILIFNPDGFLDQVNLSWKKMWGLSDKELQQVLAHYNVLNDEMTIKYGHMPLILKAFNGEAVVLPLVEYDGKETMDRFGKKINAKKVWIIASYYPVKNNKGEVVKVVGMVENYTERKLWEEETINYQKRLQDLALELIFSEEKQRKQIATDLHDDVGQLLASSRIQIATIDPSMDKSAILDKMKEISIGLRDAITATQHAIFELRPPQLGEIGLKAALSDWMEEELERKHGIKAIILGEDTKHNIDDEVRYLLFRCVRELLLNVVKHSKSSQVTVDIAEKNELLYISVHDNGIGFNTNQDLVGLKGSGFGLFSIRERIQNIGGDLQIKSTIGSGTKIFLSLPFQDK